jgi:hypothetical protein
MMPSSLTMLNNCEEADCADDCGDMDLQLNISIHADRDDSLSRRQVRK